MKLADVFRSVDYKLLTGVDVCDDSHQHEIGIPREMRDSLFEAIGRVDLLGVRGCREKLRFEVSWIVFADGDEAAFVRGSVTLYDSRATQPDRSPEWRLYYDRMFPDVVEEEDLLVMLVDCERRVFGVFFKSGSRAFQNALSAFDIEPRSLGHAFRSVHVNAVEMEFFRKQILNTLGLGKFTVESFIEGYVESRFETFLEEGCYPSTRQMAESVYEIVSSDARSEPDTTLCRWLEVEEQIFYSIERRFVEARLQVGFSSVDDFVSFSLSVQNRRKSRMGHSFQWHLCELWKRNEIRFAAQQYTEGRVKPDFVFPSIEAYRNDRYPTDALTMLAAKSSCKDRWTQILIEAKRLPVKHLATIDPALTNFQLNEMVHRSVQVVMPEGILNSYNDEARRAMLSMRSFIELLKARQGSQS